MRNRKETNTLHLLKVLNLILISSALMMIISLIIFNLYDWGHIKQTSVFLWSNLMLLIVVASYTYGYKFETSGENWMNFNSLEEECNYTITDTIDKRIKNGKNKEK